ncbi:hypothetical protein PHLGIDRAFT_28960 [Phlebiopsis gigantea 11061_1 CR5-6]|uniref:Gfo/Idh/MocA-like oxidoreductase N-terminal domain-containing protein n=1 Tax=Phlebiopsis gigantea (strain 11061_1 CR5-6) TaxID=745531 RepID=A0A0C3PR09_PHLG1|nr:hypothetical protein PHLGIDRAFT_28960 [Phlebiopsis gigantea 11061_1 CR5-6]
MSSDVVRPSLVEHARSSQSNSRTGSRRGSIDPAALMPMHKVPQVSGVGDFNVVFVGAGNIMFGSDEGPWNHSFRFEHKLGPRLKVVAIIDPAVDRAKATLQKKCETFVRSAYQNTKVFRTLDEFVAGMTPNDAPRAFVVGSPPMFRGTTQPRRDVELQILKHFPGVALFVEKPVATGPREEIAESYKVAEAIQQSGSICSVGYMLRYLRAVQMMKQIIEENNLTVMATIARYATAYEAISKLDWWDKSKSAGPIIEQGTHFCDLSRYFGGDVDISSISAHSLEWDEPAGKLSKMNVDESLIPEQNRISRVTSATWKYENGAVGSFVHLTALQGHDYSCELEVFADGYQLKLVNPYVQPVLYVRRPGSDAQETHTFSDDDPFFSEVSVFIDNIEDIEENPDTAQILSSFEDGVKTYQLTWAIREAGERSRAERLAKKKD